MKARKASFRRNYPIKRIFFFVFLKCFVICGFGQDLSTFSLHFGKKVEGFSTEILKDNLVVNSWVQANFVSAGRGLGYASLSYDSLQPAWINPDPGYLSFLCRKELEIEKKSPIPFWFQIGENDPALVRHPRGGAVSSIKFKFKIN